MPFQGMIDGPAFAFPETFPFSVTFVPFVANPSGYLPQRPMSAQRQIGDCALAAVAQASRLHLWRPLGRKMWLG